jgi:hypothetical protein
MKTPAASPKGRLKNEDAGGRRRFLKTIGSVFAAGAASTLIPGSRSALGAPKAAAPSVRAAAAARPAETYVKQLHDSLTPAQKQIVLFPFDHEKRSYVSNNWNIVDENAGAIGTLYNRDQQELIRQILKGVTSEDGYERFQKQMKEDGGGFEKYTCAIFGRPGQDKFEWVMTGRHLTIRADGNSVENTAFGGPIFYGHAVTFDEKPDHPGNVWWHQARLANDVFKSLDGKQREKALIEKDPPDEQSSLILRGTTSPACSGRSCHAIRRSSSRRP